jgi:hypothetical protein
MNSCNRHTWHYKMMCLIFVLTNINIENIKYKITETNHWLLLRESHLRAMHSIEINHWQTIFCIPTHLSLKDLAVCQFFHSSNRFFAPHCFIP